MCIVHYIITYAKRPDLNVYTQLSSLAFNVSHSLLFEFALSKIMPTLTLFTYVRPDLDQTVLHSDGIPERIF